jgi:hypothetical protein
MDQYFYIFGKIAGYVANSPETGLPVDLKTATYCENRGVHQCNERFFKA